MNPMEVDESLVEPSHHDSLIESSHHDFPSPQHNSTLIKVFSWLGALAFLFLLVMAGIFIYIAFVRPYGSTSKPKFYDQISKIAFGSCVSYHNAPQPIWNGVIARKPDAWIWHGDFVYMDVPTVNCSLPVNVALPMCNCSTLDWIKIPPNGCPSGDLEHSLRRIQIQLRNPNYSSFLNYMCLNHDPHLNAPPTGTDPEICPRAILGTWDDHDYAWNNGNRRLPNKHEHKQVYLDGIGEPQVSERRSSSRGMEWKYTFNKGTDREIGVFLLDSRYYRDPLPCQLRRDWCKSILKTGPSENSYGWCLDFLQGRDLESTSTAGSCCAKDEQFYWGWCKTPAAKSSPFYESACNATSEAFGSIPLEFVNGHPQVPDMFAMYESTFCELLGSRQRRWLQEQLKASTARLNLIVSSSVLFHRPGLECSSDDWDCYNPAQINMLSMLANSEVSCPVLLVGDYHWGDITVARAGNDTPYASVLQTQSLPFPIYQIMASGMTDEMFAGIDHANPCTSYRADPFGFRVPSNCSIVIHPHFGEIEVAWSESDPTVHLRLSGVDGAEVLAHSFHLSECRGTHSR